MIRTASVAAALCAACLTSACVHIGPSRLKADQVDYARSRYEQQGAGGDHSGELIVR